MIALLTFTSEEYNSEQGALGRELLGSGHSANLPVPSGAMQSRIQKRAA